MCTLALFITKKKSKYYLVYNSTFTVENYEINLITYLYNMLVKILKNVETKNQCVDNFYF